MQRWESWFPDSGDPSRICFATALVPLGWPEDHQHLGLSLSSPSPSIDGARPHDVGAAAAAVADRAAIVVWPPLCRPVSDHLDIRYEL